MIFQPLVLEARQTLADISSKNSDTIGSLLMPTPAGIALAADYRLRLCPRKACSKAAIKAESLLDSFSYHTTQQQLRQHQKN